MPRLMKQKAHPQVNKHNTPEVVAEITLNVPDFDLLAQADGILGRSAAISATDEEILFKTLELCAAFGERGEGPCSEGVRSPEDIDILQRKVVAYLVERNIILVYQMRKRCPLVGMDPDEMLSVGCWALYCAVKGFNVWRGLRFSTYACRSILNSFQSLARKRRRERVVLESLLQGRPTVTHPNDLEVAVDGPMLMDKVSAALCDTSAGITDIERFVIEQRFLAAPKDGTPTYESIGRVFQISKERVRQIKCGALAKLRSVLTHRRTLGGRLELAFAE